MANFFDQLDTEENLKILHAPAKGDKAPETVKADAKAQTTGQATVGPRKEDGSLQGDSWVSRAGKTLADGSRALSNALTFGLADKARGAMGNIGEEGERAISRKSQTDSPMASAAGTVAGLAGPGMGISKLLGAISPLGRATIPSIMGNQAGTGATISALDDMGHGNIPDPAKAAGAAAIGGGVALPASIMARVLSPGARVRAAGSELNANDKTSMEALMRESSIPVTAPEAARAVAPGRSARLEGAQGSASMTPRGSEASANFERARIPLIEQEARRVAGVVGQGSSISGLETKTAATDAIKSSKDLVQASAATDYEKSPFRMIPGSHRGPAVGEARNNIARDDVLATELGNAPTASTKNLDMVKKQLDTMFTRAQEGGQSHRAALIEGEKKAVEQGLLQNPDYARGVDTFRTGTRDLVEPLKAGPLGAISSTDDLAAQGSALFTAPSVSRPMETATAAAKRLPQANVEGLLSSRIDSMAQSQPLAIGRNLLTDEGQRAVNAVVGPGKAAEVNKLVETLKVVNPTETTPFALQHQGPVEELWNHVRNLGAAKVQRLLQDPSFVKELGRLGVGQQALNAALTAAGTIASDQYTPDLTERGPRASRR